MVFLFHAHLFLVDQILSLFYDYLIHSIISNNLVVFLLSLLYHFIIVIIPKGDDGMYLFGLNHKSFKILTTLKLLKIHELVLKFHLLLFFLVLKNVVNLISKFKICFIKESVNTHFFMQHYDLPKDY